MTTMILRKAPDRLRGEMRNWMLEVERGVFVGRCGARVRDALWERAAQSLAGGYAVMFWSDRSRPEGFAWRKAGEWPAEPVDWGGVTVMFRRAPRSEPAPCDGPAPKNSA